MVKLIETQMFKPLGYFFATKNKIKVLFKIYLKIQHVQGPQAVSYSVCPNYDSLWLG